MSTASMFCPALRRHKSTVSHKRMMLLEQNNHSCAARGGFIFHEGMYSLVPTQVRTSVKMIPLPFLAVPRENCLFLLLKLNLVYQNCPEDNKGCQRTQLFLFFPSLYSNLSSPMGNEATGTLPILFFIGKTFQKKFQETHI